MIKTSNLLIEDIYLNQLNYVHAILKTARLKRKSPSTSILLVMEKSKNLNFIFNKE